MVTPVVHNEWQGVEATQVDVLWELVIAADFLESFCYSPERINQVLT